MKRFFIIIFAAAAAVACTSKTYRIDPPVPSIEGSWLVTNLDVTAEGADAAEAEAALLALFDGWDGFTLIFNPDKTVVIPGGTALYSMTNSDLWIVTIGSARVEFTVNTLTDTEMELTCDALTGIGEPVVFPPDVTVLQLYLRAERQ